MAFGSAGVGAIRALVIGLRLDDAGVTAALGRVQASVGATRASMAGAGETLSALQGQLFLFGFAAGAAFLTASKQAADFEKQLTLASIAADTTGDQVGQLATEARQLAQEFAITPVEAAKTIRQIEQLGVASNDQAIALARASVALNRVTGGELGAADAAATLFRLAKVTNVEIDRQGVAYLRLANAIVTVGNRTAAGVPDVEKFLRTMQAAGALVGFTSDQATLLAGTIADLDQSMRELAVTSITRIFTRTFVKNAAQIAQFMGMTEQSFVSMRQNDPFDLLIKFANAVNRFQSQGGDIAPLLQQMGFTFRDIRMIGIISKNIQKLTGDLLPKLTAQNKLTNAQFEQQGAIVREVGTVMGITTSDYSRFTSSLSALGITVGQFVNPPLRVLLDLLGGLAQALADNPLLTGLLLTAGARYVGAPLAYAAFRILEARGLPFATLFGLGGGAAGMAGMGAVESAGVAAETGLDPLLAAAAIGARPGLLERLTAFLGKGAGERGGIFLSKLLGEGIAGSLGGGLIESGVGLAVGPVGLLVTALSVLGPIAGNLARTFQGLGEQGGIVGATMNGLAIVFKLIAIAGDAVNAAFRVLLELLGAIVKYIQGIPVVGGLLSGVNVSEKGILTSLDSLDNSIKNFNLQNVAGGQSSPSTVVHQTNNVYTQGSGDAANQALQQVALNATFGTSPATLKSRRSA